MNTTYPPSILFPVQVSAGDTVIQCVIGLFFLVVLCLSPLEDVHFVSLSLMKMTEAMQGVMVTEILSRCVYLTATVLV